MGGIWVRFVLVVSLLGGGSLVVGGVDASVRHLGGEVRSALKAAKRGEGEVAWTGVMDLAVVAGEVLEEGTFRSSVRALLRFEAGEDRALAVLARRALDALVVRGDLPFWAQRELEVELREAMGSRDMDLRLGAVRLLLRWDPQHVAASEAWLDFMDDSRSGIRWGALSALLDLARDGGYEAGEAVRARLQQRLEGEDTLWGFDAGLALWVISQGAGDGLLQDTAESALARGLVNAGGGGVGLLLRRMEVVLQDQPRRAPGRLLVEVLCRVVEERSPEVGVLGAVDLALLAPAGSDGDYSDVLLRVLPAYSDHPSLDVRMAAFGALGRYGVGRLLGMGLGEEFPEAVREVLSNVFDLPVSEAQVAAITAMMGDRGFVVEHSEEMIRVLVVGLASSDRAVVRAALSSELAGLYARPEAERLRGWVLRDLGRLGEEGVRFCVSDADGAFDAGAVRKVVGELVASGEPGVRRLAGAALLWWARGGEVGFGEWFAGLAVDEHPSVAWYGVGGLLVGGMRGDWGDRRRLEGLVEAVDPGVRLRLLGILGGSWVPAWGGGVLEVEEGDWVRGLRVRMMREDDAVVREVLGRRR